VITKIMAGSSTPDGVPAGTFIGTKMDDHTSTPDYRKT
jgi:hypothetical protein